MILFKFLPNELFYLVVIGGIIGLVLLEFLPQITYTKLLKIVSATLIVTGIYFIGALHENEIWQARIKELELKLATAQIASTKVNTKIETRVLTQTNTIRERGNDVIQYVDKEIIKYDTTCVIPPEFIIAHNKAATK